MNTYEAQGELDHKTVHCWYTNRLTDDDIPPHGDGKHSKKRETTFAYPAGHAYRRRTA